MSFAFTAIGTKEEVGGQLERAQIPGGEGRFNEFGLELRDLLVRHFGAEDTGGHEYKYVVKASGHGGGTSPLSVQLAVEPFWMQPAPAE
jgi:hypothetical protein